MNALKTFSNKQFQKNFDTNFIENIKKYKKVNFSPIKNV